MAWHGMAWHGMAWQLRSGVASQVLAWQGAAGQNRAVYLTARFALNSYSN